MNFERSKNTHFLLADALAWNPNYWEHQFLLVNTKHELPTNKQTDQFEL